MEEKELSHFVRMFEEMPEEVFAEKAPKISQALQAIESRNEDPRDDLVFLLRQGNENIVAEARRLIWA